MTKTTVFDYDKIFSVEPYALTKDEKADFLVDIMRTLTGYHSEKCVEYRRILDALGLDVGGIKAVEDVPFLPVRLFKDHELKSVEENDIVKTMTSSGTTGMKVSKIYLDRETAAQQTKALTKIVSSNIGKARFPMIVLDSSAVINNRTMFSARGAGILGFSIFGRDRIFALDDDMNLDRETLDQFLEKHSGKEFLLFGFTFMIWQHFYEQLKGLEYHPDFSKGTLIHGGGWKSLAVKEITPERFKQALKEVCGIERVRDYYGMVEQTGTIHMECERGYLHTSVYSDVIIRRHEDFSMAEVGERGIIQCLSVLPRSYPGHSLLTEDEGILLGEDDCECGRKGKYFRVLGRLKNAEIRGCSDTYASRFA